MYRVLSITCCFELYLTNVECESSLVSVPKLREMVYVFIVFVFIAPVKNELINMERYSKSIMGFIKI